MTLELEPAAPTEQEMSDFEADLDSLVRGGEIAASQPDEAFTRASIYEEN